MIQRLLHTLLSSFFLLTLGICAHAQSGIRLTNQTPINGMNIKFEREKVIEPTFNYDEVSKHEEKTAEKVRFMGELAQLRRVSIGELNHQLHANA